MADYFIETMGCPKNQEDSERLEGILTQAGHRIVDNPDDADGIIINTCGFIEDAKRESIDAILSALEYKNDDKKIIVSGCLSQRYADELSLEIPEVDVFVGVNDYDNLPEILQDEGADKRVFTDGAPGILTNPRPLSKNKKTAYLKVAEGCDNRCTYCVIPDIRGPYRSVPKQVLLKEANDLVENGVRELVLIAQDVTAYGSDLYGKYALPELLELLCSIDDLKWIRLMYCYEERITDELIEVMKRNDKICNYIDIPLQHISQNVLKRMNRKSTPQSIRETIRKLRDAMPDIAIRTTFITGFPGETEDDQEQLVEFVEEERFQRLGVFTYSQEEGTPAAQMPDQVSHETAQKRKDEIMMLQMDISYDNNRDFLGKNIQVIVDEIGDDAAICRSRYDAPEIDNAVLIPDYDGIKAGQFLITKIIEAYDYDLIGEITDESTK